MHWCTIKVIYHKCYLLLKQISISILFVEMSHLVSPEPSVGRYQESIARICNLLAEIPNISICGGIRSVLRRSCLASILKPKIARQLTWGEFTADKPIQPETPRRRFVSSMDGKKKLTIWLIWIPQWGFPHHSLLFNSNMEPRPTPNILHDHPLNNVVKKDWIHVEGLKKEWRSVEQLAKAEPRYHINPYKK